MNYLRFFCIFFLATLISCTHTVTVKNKHKGKLTATYQMVISHEKKILLDDNSAPRPPYMQMIEEDSGRQVLTFLNPYKNGIFFYDFEMGILLKTVEYEREGPNAIRRLECYFVKNMDSIYVFHGPLPELVLTDSSGYVKKRFSLIDNKDRSDNTWPLYYPQYEFYTVNPIIETRGKLILTGSAPFGIADDSLIHKFRFTANFDLQSNIVEFMHSYPAELYGSNPNWPGMAYTLPYSELSPTGGLIYSFPVSHDIYISQWDKEGYEKVYAGSNNAGTIRSIAGQRLNSELIISHCLKHDLYTCIRYDPYRNVYYRFMSQGMHDFTIKTSVREKPVVVIVMDESFSYLCETVLGSAEKWNWLNSFVTSEGLMIEYFDPDLDSEEEYLTFKILTLIKL